MNGILNKDRIFLREEEKKQNPQPPDPKDSHFLTHLQTPIELPPDENEPHASRLYNCESARLRGNSAICTGPVEPMALGPPLPASTPVSAQGRLDLKVSLASQLFSASSVLGSLPLSFLPNLPPPPSHPALGKPCLYGTRLAHQELKDQIELSPDRLLCSRD